MSFADNRQIKSFVETVTRTFTSETPGDAKGKWEVESDDPIDDQINHWVRDTGNMILQVNPTWSQLPDEYMTDGRMIRRSITRYAIVFTTEKSYFDMEARSRSMAMLGEGAQPAERPVPLGTEDQDISNILGKECVTQAACAVNTGKARVIEISADDEEVVTKAPSEGVGGPPGIDNLRQVVEDNGFNIST